MGPLAAWLHVAALAYCNRNRTDGFIPHSKLAALVSWPPDLALRNGPQWVPVETSVLARDLVECGLWEQEVIGNQPGYILVGFLLFHPSAVDMVRMAKIDSDRKTRWRQGAAKRRRSVKEEWERDPDDLEEVDVSGPDETASGRDTVAEMEASGPDESASGRDTLDVETASGRDTAAPLQPPGTGVPGIAIAIPAGPVAPGVRSTPQTPHGGNGVVADQPVLASASDLLPTVVPTIASPLIAQAERRNDRLSAEAEKRAVGNPKVQQFFDAVLRLDPEVHADMSRVFSPRAAKHIKDCRAPVELIAGAYVDARRGRWGDRWLRNNMSIWACIDRLDAYQLYLEDQLGAGPVAPPKPPAQMRPPANETAAAVRARTFRASEHTEGNQPTT